MELPSLLICKQKFLAGPMQSGDANRNNVPHTAVYLADFNTCFSPDQKEAAAAGPPLNPIQLASNLEPQRRTERHFQVIASAVVEVDLVPRFQSQAERSPESLNSATRVRCKASVTRRNTVNLVDERRTRNRARRGKIYEPHLAGDKYPERPRRSCLELWSE
jgi:hypothetical protein